MWGLPCSVHHLRFGNSELGTMIAMPIQRHHFGAAQADPLEQCLGLRRFQTKINPLDPPSKNGLIRPLMEFPPPCDALQAQAQGAPRITLANEPRELNQAPRAAAAPKRATRTATLLESMKAIAS